MKVEIKEIPVRYNGKRYLPGDSLEIKNDAYDENLFEEVESSNVIDLSEYSREELEKVNNNRIKEYLDELEINYSSRANKDELITLIFGEEVTNE